MDGVGQRDSLAISTGKFLVTIEEFAQFGGKSWVKVCFRNTGQLWIPSFADLWRIIQPICDCEDMKYPHGEGRIMVERFLRDSCHVPDWDRLQQEYEIPKRNNGQVRLF